MALHNIFARSFRYSSVSFDLEDTLGIEDFLDLIIVSEATTFFFFRHLQQHFFYLNLSGLRVVLLLLSLP